MINITRRKILNSILESLQKPTSTDRVRKCRELKKAGRRRPPPKTAAERARAYRDRKRAKKYYQKKRLYRLQVENAQREPLSSVPLKKIAVEAPQQNTDVINLFTELLKGQKKISDRLEDLVVDQKEILKNQSILSRGQETIFTNQQQLAGKLENITQNIVCKPDVFAQNEMLPEFNVTNEMVEQPVWLLTGESSSKVIEAMLPVQNISGLREIEDKLNSLDFAQAMTTHIRKLKGVSKDVDYVIRSVFTDDLLEHFNWDGRWEKMALGVLQIVNRIIRDVFPNQSTMEFEKCIKKSIEKSHHRVNQRTYLANKKANMP